MELYQILIDSSKMQNLSEENPYFKCKSHHSPAPHTHTTTVANLYSPSEGIRTRSMNSECREVNMACQQQRSSHRRISNNMSALPGIETTALACDANSVTWRLSTPPQFQRLKRLVQGPCAIAFYRNIRGSSIIQL